MLRLHQGWRRPGGSHMHCRSSFRYSIAGMYVTVMWWTEEDSSKTYPRNMLKFWMNLWCVPVKIYAFFILIYNCVDSHSMKGWLGMEPCVCVFDWRSKRDWHHEADHGSQDWEWKMANKHRVHVRLTVSLTNRLFLETLIVSNMGSSAMYRWHCLSPD